MSPTTAVTIYYINGTAMTPISTQSPEKSDGNNECLYKIQAMKSWRDPKYHHYMSMNYTHW